MKRLLIFLTILTFGCTAEKKADKNFADLTQDEQVKLLGQLGDEFRGDFLKYSGRVTFDDSATTQPPGPPMFVELVMDKDNRFAIRTKFQQGEVENDTATFSFQGGESNKGIGKWSELGDQFELKFTLGTVDSFFDDENNKGKIEVVDNNTLRFDKATDEIWIYKTPCKK